MKKETAFTTIVRRDESGERTEAIEVTQEEFNQIVSKYSMGRGGTRKLIPLDERTKRAEQEIGEKMKLEKFHSVDADGFEKGVVMFARWLGSLEQAMLKNKSLRIVIDYNAETLKTDFYISKPIGCE